MGRRRHQRRAHHRERGRAPRGGRGAGALALSRCARSRASRPLQEGAGRLAEHGGGRGDPEPDRAPLHRADDRGRAQSRRARRDRRLRPRAARRQGLEPLLPGADRARAVRVGHQPRAVRRGARLALPDPAEVRPPDARERQVRAALHQDRPGECRPPDRSRSRTPMPTRQRALALPGLSRDQDLLRRGRRVPGGDALHGDTAERGRHPVPLPAGLRGDASQLEPRGPVDVLGAVHRHSPPHLTGRAVRASAR